MISEQNFLKAEKLIEENKFKEYGEKNALLYWLDLGITYHYAGLWEQSINAFNKAEKLSEELFTKSVSEEVSTFLISDNMRSYAGEDYERIYINVFQSLNYLFLGKNDSALVEVRRIDDKFKALKVNYANKNTYKEDSFVRFILGIIYEAQKEYNNAFISLRIALEEYLNNRKVYPFEISENIFNKILKLAKKLNFKTEFDSINKYASNKYSWENMKYDSSSGELIILHYNGFAPYKVDSFIEVSFGEGWGYVETLTVLNENDAEIQNARRIARSIASNEQFVVSFPKYVSTQNRIKYAQINVYDENNNLIISKNTDLVSDIETIAVENLKDRIASIKVKAIARAAIKYALSKAVQEKFEGKTHDKLSKWVLKTALKVASTSTELADKRSWRMLPKEIRIKTIELSKGEYKLVINYMDEQDVSVKEEVIENVKVDINKKTFIMIRSIE